MRFLPVVERELRVASRKRGTYWNRFFTGFVVVLLCGWIWKVEAATTNEALAKVLFYTIAGFAFAYSILVGVQVTADSLSEEKREGTMGLLFLTDLRGVDVILGKLFATSLTAFYRLLAVFPALALPFLLGSFVLDEFLRMTLVLLVTALLSLCAGMFVSALSFSERRAMLGTFGLLLFLLAGGPVLSLIWAKTASHPPPELLAITSIGYAFNAGSEAFYTQNPDGPRVFWTSVLWNAAWVGGLFAASAVLVPRSWQQHGQPSPRWRHRRTQGEAGRAGRAGLLDLNPFCWLAGRRRTRYEGVLALLLSGVGCAYGLYLLEGGWSLEPELLMFMAFSLHLVLKLMITLGACRELGEERRAGTLEMLLSTPLRVPEILQGQLRALLRQFGLALALVLSFDLVVALGSLPELSLERHLWLEVWLCGVLILLADLWALAWLGMWLGYRGRKYTWAVFQTIAAILPLPWVAMVLLGSFKPQSIGSGRTFLLVFTGISLLNSFVFFLHARHQLRTRFRQVATRDTGSTLPDRPSQSWEALPRVPAPEAPNA